MAKTRKVVAGLDPSLTGFGLAIWPETAAVPELHRFKTDPTGVRVSQRFTRYGKLLRRVFDHLDIWEPQIVVIEHYAYAAVATGDAGNAQLQQGHYDRVELGGLLRADLLACTYIEQVHEVAPMSIKAFVMKGNASKEEIKNRIYSKHGILAATTDEADAAGCALIARCLAGWDHPEDERQCTALGRLTDTVWEARPDVVPATF